MPRPHKPGYFASRKCWRFMLDGQRRYICKGIGPDERPQREGIPRRVWDEMDRIIRASEESRPVGTDPTVYWLVQGYLGWLKAEVAAGRSVAKTSANADAHLSLFLEIGEKGSVRASELSSDDMDEFFTRFRVTRLERTGGFPSGHYLHNCGKTVRAMFKWASRAIKGRDPSRLISLNPLDGYKFPVQPGAVRGYIEAPVVRRFLRWAWAEARWADMIRRPGATEAAPRLKPGPSTVDSLKRRFDRIFVLMLRFQRLTGCRPGEAVRLEWSEITHPAYDAAARRFDGAVITIRAEKVKTRKQTSRVRRIWITAPVARLLRAIDRLPGHHPVFVFPHMRGTNAATRGELDPLAGEPWPDGSAASAKLTKLRDRAIAARAAVLASDPDSSFLAGLEEVGPRKLVAYANRHAYASESSSLGFSDEQVAEQLGNTPEVMRRVYAHSVEDAAADRAHQIAEQRRHVVRKRDRPTS